MNVRISQATFFFFTLVLPVVLLPSISFAEVGDPTIKTDHAFYPGEGAFQTIEDCLRFATRGTTNAQDKALAQFHWFLTHQWHLMSPQEWCIPGRIPDTAQPRDYESVIYDANVARFSFGYGLCGTVHSWNEPYWKALGMPPRRRAFPGHVNSEIYYDGAWHAFDTDMAGLLFRKDGIVAGYDDIIHDVSLAESVKPPYPHYPFAWPGDFNTMKNGWQQVAKKGKWYKLYNGGYACQPGIVHLRSGETFTRYFDRDHFGGPTKRRFWHNMKGGPQRYWTFANRGEPHHNGKESNSRGRTSYCNGEFIYVPDLTREKIREELVASSANLGNRHSSPRLYSKNHETTSATFRHFSPYVICGDPVDDANAMSAEATNGFVISGTSVGQVQVDVSNDFGQTWHREEPVDGDFKMDRTEILKGRFGWQVRFTWAGKSGIDRLAFATTTQVSQAIYPRLRAGGSTVTYRSGNRGVVAVVPNFGVPESEIERIEDVARRSPNVVYKGRGPKSRWAYQTTNNKPGHIVFQVTSPQRLREVRAAVRYQIRVPPPKDNDYRLELSTDHAKTWQPLAKANIPSDNEFSSGWLYGKTKLAANENTTEALIRVTLFSGGYHVGLLDFRLFGIYETRPPGPLKLTYAWKEEGKLRTHSESISADATTHTFQVPTGSRIADEYVRLEAR
ncbi:MAG: hypothetical protein ACC628_08765 [Pirellulaceae bacterium]